MRATLAHWFKQYPVSGCLALATLTVIATDAFISGGWFSLVSALLAIGHQGLDAIAQWMHSGRWFWYPVGIATLTLGCHCIKRRQALASPQDDALVHWEAFLAMVGSELLFAGAWVVGWLPMESWVARLVVGVIGGIAIWGVLLPDPPSSKTATPTAPEESTP
jgi:hypothetical protein